MNIYIHTHKQINYIYIVWIFLNILIIMSSWHLIYENYAIYYLETTSKRIFLNIKKKFGLHVIGKYRFYSKQMIWEVLTIQIPS